MLRHVGLVPLSQDHQHALALCVLTDRALAANPGEEAAIRAAADILRKFDQEIQGHFEFEERELFPALAGLPELATTVEELLIEHTEMLTLIAMLRSHGDRETVSRFSRVLREHVHKEERLLFEKVQQLLTGEQLERVGDKRRAM